MRGQRLGRRRRLVHRLARRRIAEGWPAGGGYAGWPGRVALRARRRIGRLTGRGRILRGLARRRRILRRHARLLRIVHAALPAASG